MSKVVSQVLYYNQAQQYPQIQRDLQDVKTHVNKVDPTDEDVKKAALESIPMFRRVASLPDKLQNGDAIPALGVASLALINLPEDMRDVINSKDQIQAFCKGQKYQGGYDYNNFQHDFSFFRGTMLEPLVDKSKNPKRAEKLLEYDKTLLGTGFGKKTMHLLKVNIDDAQEVKKFNQNSKTWELAKDINGGQRFALSFEGSAFGKLTARAMNRTTLLGTAALALLELPNIFKAMNQGNGIAEQTGNTVKQTVKSGINLASITAGIAYGGAIGSKYGKGLGSLVGMGAGAVMGTIVSSKAQELV